MVDLNSPTRIPGRTMLIDEAGTVIGPSNPLSAKVDHSTTGIGHGRKLVAVAGTDEAIAVSTPAKWVIIQALSGNTGTVAVGSAGVDADPETGTGLSLAAGESISIPIENLSDIYVDAETSGEGVRFVYGT